MIEDGARDGHTGAVAAAARLLAAEGCAGMLTLPGDIPLVTAAEIGQLIAAHAPAPSFTIVPSHDERGSNAILLSPPDAVPLRFGDDSFFPHLRAAEARGISADGPAPARDRLDIDNPEDLAAFMRQPSQTPHPRRCLPRMLMLTGRPTMPAGLVGDSPMITLATILARAAADQTLTAEPAGAGARRGARICAPLMAARGAHCATRATAISSPIRARSSSR